MNRFTSEASFWVPESLALSAWIEHAPFAFWLMDVHRPRMLVELGTHEGYSYFAFNQALKSLAVKSRCFAIDSWKGDEHTGYYGDEVFARVRAYNDEHYASFSELIRSTFDEAVGLFADGTIDFLHIDGRHFYEDVKHDFDAWKPKLSERAVVVLHDTNVRVKDFGVYHLWEELKEQYPHFEFLHGYGLGILRVGAVMPEALTALFAASGDENAARSIRQAYGRLGAALCDRVDLVGEREKLEGLSEVAVTNKSLQEDLSTTRAELSRLSTELLQTAADRDRVWNEKQSVESALDLTRAEGVKISAEWDSLISELSNRQADAEQLRSVLSEMKAEKQMLEVEVNRLEGDLAKLNAERGRLSANLSDSLVDRQRLASDLLRQRTELHRLLSSSSWRMTSPLRWVTTKLPWLRFLFVLPFQMLWWAITLQFARRIQLLRDTKLLLNSDLLNARFYLEQNPEVAKAGSNPLQHYLTEGGLRGCDPHPVFDSDWYLQKNPDVASSGVNPLVHYLRRGRKEGRSPHPLFDCSFYEGQNTDLAGRGIDLFQHYLSIGGFQGRDPHPLFNSYWYLGENPDVASSGINPLAHYLYQGWKEGRDPNPLFDTSFYLKSYPDVVANGTNPLVHYAVFGASEGRLPNRWFGKQHPQTLPTVCGQEEWDKYGRHKLNALLVSTAELLFPSPEYPDVTIILILHNKAHLSLLCLDSITANAHCNYELIIVDNKSTDETHALLDRCKGAKAIRNSANLGFGEACMIGVAQSRGEYLLFLNNDTLLEPGAISSALSNFQDSTVGAVGGKILLANGDLQEAGSVVWSDGTTHGYGRLDRSDLPQYEFRRPVDYCSAAFLFTPRRLFNRLGGFDPVYAPAYYEDADYCLKVWEAGLKVIYDPQSVVRHYESASSDGNELARPLMAANKTKFVARWEGKLSVHCTPSMNHLVRARVASRSTGLRILYLDDFIPRSSQGAGFPRSNDILRILASQGHHVTCASMRSSPCSPVVEYEHIAREIELLDGTKELEKLFRDHVPNADLLWISRPRNLVSFLDMATEYGGFFAKLVFDTEAISSERDRLCAKLQDRPISHKILDVRQKREIVLARAADAVVVVSRRDQAIMEREGIPNVHVLGFSLVANQTPAPFSDRKTFLFVGAIHGKENPNADSIRFFCNKIWPQVHQRTGAELVIAGVGTDRYLQDNMPPGVKIVGAVDDLTPLYNQARVFVVPTRYAAGIPYKVYEAAARGVPLVVSRLIGDQVEWKHDIDLLIAEDAVDFAELCCRLYNDTALWKKLRASALSRVRVELDPVIFSCQISDIITGLDFKKANAGGSNAMPDSDASAGVRSLVARSLSS